MIEMDYITSNRKWYVDGDDLDFLWFNPEEWVIITGDCNTGGSVGDEKS